MTRYQPGDTYRVSLDTTQPGDPPVRVDADAVTLTITQPDGTIEVHDLDSLPDPGPVMHSGLGAYYYDAAIAAGTTLYRWNAVGSDPFPWTVVEGDQVYAAALGLRLLSLDEAKDALKYRRNLDNGQDDDLINDLIDTVTGDIEGLCGPVLPRLVTEPLRSGGCLSVLRQWPVIELVSVDGDEDPAGGLAGVDLVDAEIGTYTSTVAGVLVYRAGRVLTPAGIRTGAREWIKHRWRGGTQRSAATPGAILTTDDYQARDDNPGSVTYGMPFEVADALRDYVQGRMA
jgi:hypothetical protein